MVRAGVRAFGRSGANVCGATSCVGEESERKTANRAGNGAGRNRFADGVCSVGATWGRSRRKATERTTTNRVGEGSERSAVDRLGVGCRATAFGGEGARANGATARANVPPPTARAPSARRGGAIGVGRPNAQSPTALAYGAVGSRIGVGRGAQPFYRRRGRSRGDGALAVAPAASANAIAPLARGGASKRCNGAGERPYADVCQTQPSVAVLVVATTGGGARTAGVETPKSAVSRVWAGCQCVGMGGAWRPPRSRRTCEKSGGGA